MALPIKLKAVSSLSTAIVKEASTAWGLLNGVMCVYKQPGISIGRTSLIIRRKLCDDLNELNRVPSADIVDIERIPKACIETSNPRPAAGGENNVIAEIEDGKGVIRVVRKKNYSADPLVIGSGYLPEDIRTSHAYGLGKDSSGMMILGVNKGRFTAKVMEQNRWLRTFVVSGEFGKATDTSFHTGRVLLKARYHRIEKTYLERYLTKIQAAHQKLAFQAAGVTMDSERAFQLASKGLVRPATDSHPIIYNLKCLHFDLPYFEIEVSCINETELYLWQFVHELGIKMGSAATCTKVRCVKVGPFDLSHALLPKHWNLENITQNFNDTSSILKTINLFERDTIVNDF